jgi:hypothetical protein
VRRAFGCIDRLQFEERPTRFGVFDLRAELRTLREIVNHSNLSNAYSVVFTP